jgi:hypothetical protein
MALTDLFKARVRVTINAGLGKRYGANRDVLAIRENLRAAWVKDWAQMRGLDLRFEHYHMEKVAVIHGDLYVWPWQPAKVEAQLFALARDLNQDCIAVYFHQTGEGVLIGPNTRPWGRFDSKFFNFF